MHLVYTLIFGGAAVFIVVLGIFVKVSNHRDRKRNGERCKAEQDIRTKRIQDWIDSVEQTSDLYTLSELAFKVKQFDVKDAPGNKTAFYNARTKTVEATVTLQEESLRQRLQETEGDPDKRRDLLDSLARCVSDTDQAALQRLGLDQTSMSKEILAYDQARVTELAQQAHSTHDRSLFLQLKLLLEDVAKPYYLPRVKGIGNVSLPEEWPELVARFIESPTLKDFRVGYDDDPKNGLLRLWAAEQVHGNRHILWRAKLILAYCNSDPEYANEVGEIMMTALARQVVELHQVQGLDFEEVDVELDW